MQVLLLNFQILQELLKKTTTRNKKQNVNEIVILDRTKLNSIESKISEALKNNEINHEDLMKLIMKNY